MAMYQVSQEKHQICRNTSEESSKQTPVYSMSETRNTSSQSNVMQAALKLILLVFAVFKRLGDKPNF